MGTRAPDAAGARLAGPGRAPGTARPARRKI